MPKNEIAPCWCPSTVTIPDDRWGSFTDRCILPAGHQGEHRAPRTACDPPSWLVWEEPLDGTERGS